MRKTSNEWLEQLEHSNTRNALMCLQVTGNVSRE